MFAVIETGSKQYKVQKGMTLDVNKLDAKEGDKITLGKVILLNDDSKVQIGTPVVEGAEVSAKVITQKKGEKTKVFKMKPKKRYQRTIGFRPHLTTVEITDIKVGTAKKSSPKAEPKAEKPEKEEK